MVFWTQKVTKLMTRYYLTYLLKNAPGYLQQLQLKLALRTYNLLGTCWLVIRLSPNVEPPRVLMVVITF